MDSSTPSATLLPPESPSPEDGDAAAGDDIWPLPAGAGADAPRLVDVSGLPPAVAAALARVVAGFAQAVCGAWPVPAPRRPGGGDGVGEQPPADVAGPHTPARATLAQGQQALAVIEAVEVAKAFADAVAVEAAGVITAAYEVHLDPAAGVELGLARRAQLALAGRDGAAAEIQAATGMSATAARRLVRYARAGTARTATARALLTQGRLSLYRAAMLLERTADLSPELADQVAGEVLRPLPGHSPAGPTEPAPGPSSNDSGTEAVGGAEAVGGSDAPDGDDPAGGGGRAGGLPWCAPESGSGCVPISTDTFYRRLKASRAKHADHQPVHEREVRARRVGFELAEDGTACLWVTGAGPRVVAAHRRLDTMARAARRAGDPRTLDQLRSDLIIDLLLYGIVGTDLTDDPHPTDHATTGDQANHTDGATDATDGDAHGDHPADGPRESEHPGQPQPQARARRRVPFAVKEAPAPGPTQRRTWDLIGAPPPALVHVVVTLDTLTGGTDGTGELPGYGFLPATQTRQVCLAAGSTWRRLVTDPASGHLVELTSTTYQAPPALAAQVDARDHLCRGPGCTVPAERCDFDHDTDHADGGPTATSNGSAKHRRHHNLKTRRLWHTRQHPDGTITWTTLLGRHYTTQPHDYRELDPDPHPDDKRDDGRPTADDTEPPF